MPLPIGVLNLTNSSVELRDMGIFIPPGSGTLIDLTGEFLVEELRSSDSLQIQVVTSGTVAVSGSEGILSTEEAINFFAGNRVGSENFTSTGFDLRTLSATAAIVGAGNVTVTSGTDTTTVSGSNSATGGVLEGTLYTVGFTTPGSAGDKWMSNNSEDPLSNEVTCPMPFNSKLVAVTYTSKKSGTRGNIEIHKADFGATNSNSAIFTWSMTSNRRIATKTDISGVTVDAGDKIGIFIERTTGVEPDTVVVMLYWQITDDTQQELDENYGGNFS